jgi:hypothetical protein
LVIWHFQSLPGFDMRTKVRIWLGVGASIIVGTTATAAGKPVAQLPANPSAAGARADVANARTSAAAPIALAQHVEPGKEAGEGGEAKGLANLPPDLAFAVRIALLRGHLLIGDELVKQQQWNAALPHFLHPNEEIYGDIKDELADYNVPPFDMALKALADAVKGKRADYANRFKEVNDALVAADAGMKVHQDNWPGFVVEAAVEALKAAAGEYQLAIVNGRIAKPVEYQDARGFISQAQRMIEGVAADLQKKDPPALAVMRAGLTELKKAFPSAMPPKVPVKDHAAVLADVARIEVAAGKLM